MALNAPTVTPLSNGILKTATGVLVRVSYANPGADDMIEVHWGIYSAQPGPGPMSLTAPVDFSISTFQVCDGTATVWYRARDAIGNAAYSATAQVQISGTGQQLDAPTLIAVNPKDPTQGMQAMFSGDRRFMLTLKATDTATISYTIFDASNDMPVGPVHSTTLATKPLANGSFTTPALLPVPGTGQYVILTYTLIRQIDVSKDDAGLDVPASAQSFLSAGVRKSNGDLFPVAGNLPAPLFLNAPNDMLDLGTIAAGDIPIQIPATPLVANTNVVFHGRGADAGGAAIGAAAWTSDSVLVPATPYSGTPIPRSHVDAVPTGGSYAISYTVISSGQTAPEKTVTIRRSAPPPVGGQTGTLWGWGDPEWRTLG